MSSEHVITRVGEEDLDELLPLLRGYCDFYEVSPSDEALLAVSRALIADPEREGVQLIARDDGRRARSGFATIYWTWSTLERRAARGHERPLRRARGARQRARRRADRRLPRARRRARRRASWRGRRRKDNERAQAVYERVGGQRSEWLDYSLAVAAGLGSAHESRQALGRRPRRPARRGRRRRDLAGHHRRDQHLHGRVPRAARRALAARTTTTTARAPSTCSRARSRSAGATTSSRPPSSARATWSTSRRARRTSSRTSPTSERAEYVVARDSPTEDSVEVPWAEG